MTNEEIMEVMDKYTKKADKLFNEFQQTGITRYYSQYRAADEIAEVCRLAAAARDDHYALASLRVNLCNLADMAERVIASRWNPEEARKVLKTVITSACLECNYTRRIT